jgi:hypothetical protein
MWPQFRQRAAWLAARFPNTARIGIAGAGCGLTGYYLYTEHGIDPFMCDTQWAANIGAGIIPGGTSRIRALDMTISNQANQFRQMANSGQARQWPVFTEDLLPAADSEAEVATMLTNIRTTSQFPLVHLVTPLMPDTEQTSDMLWRTMAQWRTLVGPSDVLVDMNLIEQVS